MYTEYMKKSTDISYGIIPLRKRASSFEVFLIHQIGRTGQTFWGFPKGHPEEGETPKAAAVRELFEETELTLDTVLPHIYMQTYTFIHEGEEIEKTVHYFLGVVASDHFVIQETEVVEAGWFSFEEALQLLTFKGAQDILMQTKADIRAYTGI
jgi:8-oxo-dGTP pyrophosphatase MutT (NUDIX family)